MGLWDDDPAFKNLANNKFMRLKRLSWQCSQLMCDQCDGFIHYKFKKVKSEYYDARTGKKHQEIEDFEWNTEFESVQLEGGVNQDKINTPEGSKCECHHCHGRPGYDKWKEAKQKPNTIGKMFVSNLGDDIVRKPRELTDEEREALK